MKYYLNPNTFTSAFSLPSKIVDDYLNLASQIEIKVIIYYFRHLGDGFDIAKCASALGISAGDVNDALLFWVGNGILLSDSDSKNSPDDLPQKPKSVVKNVKPNRLDVAKRGLEDENVAFILRHAQEKFGRNLKTNESSTLLYIYDDLGLDVSVILFLMQYALNEGKLNIRFIEKTAVDWVNSGVETVIDAESVVAKNIKLDLAWKRTEKAFGIEHRKPSADELKYSNIWFNEWMLDDEVLKLAYDVCVNAKSKFVFKYCAKTIENWYKEGKTSPEEIKKTLLNDAPKTSNGKKYDYAGYDLDLYEKMLNSDD